MKAEKLLLAIASSCVVISASSRGEAQSIDSYSGVIERKAFRTWSENPQMAANAKQTTDFTESQITLVRIERGKVTATYQLDYIYDTKGSNSGAYMDGRCPVSTVTSDVENQYFPEQGVPASALFQLNGVKYGISVRFNDNAVGVRTAGSVKILNYNRGAKSCPDNPDRNESSAKDFIRAVDAIRIADQPLVQNGSSLIGSYTTPASTVNAKPNRIETGWETVRWSLFRDGATCPWMDPGKVQYYKGLAAEMRRVEQERNDAARDLAKVAMNDQAESTRLSNKKNAANTRLRQLTEMTLGSPFMDQPRGTPISAQAFASYGCGTKG